MGRPIFLLPTLNSEKTINSGFFLLVICLSARDAFANFPQQLGGLGASAPGQVPWNWGRWGWRWGGPSATSGCPAVPGLIFPRADPEQSWCSGASPATTADGTEPLLVRKSSPNLSVKGVHCQQAAWAPCHFVTSPVTDTGSPFQPLCFQSLFFRESN